MGTGPPQIFSPQIAQMHTDKGNSGSALGCWRLLGKPEWMNTEHRPSVFERLAPIGVSGLIGLELCD
jgi:hypothetical protein